MSVYDDIAKAYENIRHLYFGNEECNYYYWSAPPDGLHEFVFENLTSLVITLLLHVPNERTTQLEQFIMYLKRAPKPRGSEAQHHHGINNIRCIRC